MCFLSCRLLLVCDISCDVNGSIEFLDRTTNIDSPYYQYDPILRKEISESISNNGVTVMGVDILPTELPRESSLHFGDSLLPVLEKYLDRKVGEAYTPSLIFILSPSFVLIGLRQMPVLQPMVR
jgi:hypothetical protein